MANVEQSTFDVEFALNQFSGNRALLVKMLDRFCEQHDTFNENLLTYVENNEPALAKQDVHGLKGVSGNLGMKALHQSCREFEDDLRKNKLPNVDSSNLINMLNTTLQQVRQYTQGNAPSNLEQQSTPAPSTGTGTGTDADTDTVARQNLLKALKRNEFISQNKLTAFISELSISTDTLQRLQVSIDELDYEKAISLLE